MCVCVCVYVCKCVCVCVCVCVPANAMKQHGLVFALVRTQLSITGGGTGLPLVPELQQKSLHLGMQATVCSITANIPTYECVCQGYQHMSVCVSRIPTYECVCVSWIPIYVCMCMCMCVCGWHVCVGK